MKKEYLVYHIVLNSYMFEDHPEFLFALKTEIDPNFNVYQLSFGRGKLIQDWPENVTVYFSGWRCADYQICPSLIEIVSDRTKKVIEEVAEDQVEFLPVKSVFEDPKADQSMKFWAINVINIVDALDWDSTVWSKNPRPSREDPDAYSWIIKPRFYANKIENQHIFRYEIAGKVDSSIFVSNELRQRLIKAKCFIGIEFAPVKTI